MGYGQRNARFYCEVESARSKTEKILGDRNSGINITLAGEYGSLKIRVWASDDDEFRGRKLLKKRVDKFTICFAPWRSCNNDKGREIEIASGVLDYDEHKYENTMVRLSAEVLEAFQVTRAKEIMLEKD